MLIARSSFGKAVVTAFAVAGFVALYEATMLDSKNARSVDEGRRVQPAATPGSRLAFTATAYCKGSITAAGNAVQAGMAAADPSVLPLGSVVEIDSPDSRYDGIYTVLDTGPAVQGAMIDIYMWSCYEALDFGRQTVRLTVLRQGWNPRATAPGFMNRLFRRLEAPPPPAPQLPRERDARRSTQ